MESNIKEIIEEFMESALAQWVLLFENMVEGEDGAPLYSQYMEVNSVSQSTRDRYLRLTNGIFLNEVMRVIDPNPKVERLYNSERDDHMLRVQNFSILNRHLRAFYQEDLQQLILMPLPNVAILGQDPLTEAAVEELRRLLLLLLGSAVQCEKKETFIQQIQSLDIETQAAIASCIQQVTQDPRVVLPLQWEELVETEGADLQLVFSSMAKQIQSLLAQRDTHLERITELCRDREAQSDSTTGPFGGHNEDSPQGLLLQLADSKAKLRRLKQQLEDKGDQILDYKQEIQTMEEQLQKLQKENRSLQGDVRGMRALRDELDCARERAARSEQLQTELQSCKHRLRSLELTRTQLKEQQQLCAALQETKTLLEEQLADARARCSSLRELERDNLLLRQRIMDVEAERDTERQRVDELLEMNMSLEADLRHSSSGGSVPAPVAALQQRFFQSELESDDELSEVIDQKPLSVEVGEASTLRLLGAEQENAELKRRLEELQAQQEADSQDAKDESACLEMKHQETFREFQNLKNENATLKQRLEQLVTKLEHLEDKRKEEGVKMPDRKKMEEEEKVVRGVQGSESCRGEGEGRVRMMEAKVKREEVIGTHREAGVGEEVLYVQRGKDEGDEVLQTNRRGEAEGGQKEREKQEKESEPKKEKTELSTSSEIQKHPVEDKVETIATHLAVCSLSAPHVEILTNRLQEAQEEAERQMKMAQDAQSKLGEQTRKTWEVEQRLVLLEAELQCLKKAAASLVEARSQIEVLQSEGLVMEEELCRLRSQAELHRMQTTVIATLEGERAALERERDMLRSTVDALRTAQRKSDQLELTTQTLRAELERQGRSLETSRRREEELEAELREATLEAESLARARDQALLEASRLEQEKEVCQSELDGHRKEGRQREREAGRLRQQLESTTLALEHSNQRARALDAEHRRVCQQLSESKELCAQLQDLEKEFSIRLSSMEEGKQQLQEQYAEAQAKISSLSQDLTHGQAHSEKLATQVEHMSQKLQRSEAELHLAKDSLRQSQERMEFLSQCLKKSEPLQLEKRRGSAEVNNTSNSNSESIDTRDVSPSDQSPEAAKGRDLSMTHDHSTGEAERQLSERVIELEKEKVVAAAEHEALLTRLSQSQEACEHLKEQLEALRRHSLSLQDSCTRLQTLNTQLQVEQASLNSQHAAVLARCSESKARCATLEAESKVWAREREESVARMDTMRRDHERMTVLQQRQEVELEELLEKHSQLRSNNRSLEAQHRELEGRYKELLDGKTQLEEREREMKLEREKMEMETQRRLERERELERLKEDNDRLQAQQKEWLASQAELLAQGSVLRSELNTSQLERTRLEGELSALKESNQSLDLSNARLTSQYQLLTQLKGNMEEENRHLAEQNQSLLRENRALLEQSLERRDQHYSQQREYQEKLSELRREKQKLVEKIMDQYRVLEPSMPSPSSKAKKSNWIADRMKKLIKPRGGGREGRAVFTAAGSVENLADSTEFTSDTHTPQPDPRSAPVSPSPLRKAPPQAEMEVSLPGAPATRAGSGGRRKLGSRHGWGLGLARGGSGVSQSFSPGDHKTRQQRSSQSSNSILWEGERRVSQEADALVTSHESAEEDEVKDNQHSSDDSTTPQDRAVESP
ncbi:coiled-coil domain containing 88A [Archocentrus centrarchus]|uniref:coiled-coil domain containing 88A n=1 Tax=Archocentrus centrarchus TaxID=63155 RepID=UPI0011EA2D22|nr:girdin-like [Archocentrus centrarchus]